MLNDVTLKTSRDLVGHVQDSVRPNDKADKVCCNHCEDVQNASTRTDMSVPRMPSILIVRIKSGDDHLAVLLENGDEPWIGEVTWLRAALGE